MTPFSSMTQNSINHQKVRAADISSEAHGTHLDPTSATHDVSATSANVNFDLGAEATIPKRLNVANRKPPINDEDWNGFRRLAMDLYDNANTLKEHCKDGADVDDRSDLIVHIEESLERLYSVQFGKAECLKRCVVAIQNVILKANWDQNHISFIVSVAAFLKSRSHIDDSTVSQVYQILGENDLNPFRGILTN